MPMAMDMAPKLIGGGNLAGTGDAADETLPAMPSECVDRLKGHAAARAHRRAARRDPPFKLAARTA
jgi:hypothetical protein